MRLVFGICAYSDLCITLRLSRSESYMRIGAEARRRAPVFTAPRGGSIRGSRSSQSRTSLRGRASIIRPQRTQTPHSKGRRRPRAMLRRMRHCIFGKARARMSSNERHSAYLPLNSALRFARKALVPSLASSVAQMAPNSFASRLSPSESCGSS